MTRIIPMVSFLALSACAGGFTIPDFRTSAPPPVVQPAPAPVVAVNPLSAKERFVTATEQNGCVLNQSNSDVIMANATLSQQDLARVMSELKAEGRGRVSTDKAGFEIISSNCV